MMRIKNVGRFVYAGYLLSLIPAEECGERKLMRTFHVPLQQILCIHEAAWI
jgi:hypothetical protein